MQFGVLGPLTVSDGDVDLGGPRIRRLLAALLIDAGSVVSAERLAEIVFEGNPSPAAKTTLRSYIARLRRTIEHGGGDVRVVTRNPGYLIELGPGTTVDAIEFETAANLARSCVDDNPARALDLLQPTLALWKGPAYVEFADEEWAHAEAIRLDDLHLIAQEARHTALLALGRHDQAVPELLRFVAENPLREPARMRTMTALYRSGRHVEAMRQGDDYRNELSDIGLEPSVDFSELERHIALHDPALREPTGSQLRGYRLITELGRGRHGIVHLAIQPGVGREVAIRSYGPELADHPDFIRTIDIRVRSLAGIDHPAVVTVLDFWREPGRAHVVTQFLDGGTLVDLIRKGPCEVERAGEILTAAGGALQAAHDAGLHHGALSPADILFDDHGAPYVDDIGLGHTLDAIVGRTSPPGYGRHLGGEAGPVADQYALAVIAYEMLTGDLPYGADTDAPFPRLSEKRPELIALDGVLVRAGAIHPSDRYPNISVFVGSFSAAIGRASVRRSTVRVRNPFKGLRPFEESDADDFFGREPEVDRLLEQLNSPDAAAVVIGASGSGKSSLVRAGLIPALRAGRLHGSERWFITTMRPGRDPFAAFHEALSSVGVGSQPLPDRRLTSTIDRLLPDGAQLLIVVDQLEELFVQTPADVRNEFLEQFGSVISNPRVIIVAAMRSDFYRNALEDPVLSGLVTNAAVPLRAMDAAATAAAITAPAAESGIDFEPELVSQLVDDAVRHASALPLLQFVLSQLVDERTSDRIGVTSYRSLGGLAGAVADRAESIYASTDVTDQPAVRRLFLRLVTPGPDGVHFRRRARRSELDAAGDSPAIDPMLERFGSARLLGLDHDPQTREPTIEISHEFLLSSWPRLNEWIEEEGAGLPIRAELTDAADRWSTGGRATEDLMRGSRLARTEEWAAGRHEELTLIENAFLDASIADRDRDIIAQRRINSRLKQLVGGVAALLVVALIAGGIAVSQRNRAESEADAAVRSRGRALAAASTNAADDDMSLALLLAVEAARLDWSPPASAALLSSLVGVNDTHRRLLPTPATDYTALVLAGTVAAAQRSDGSVDIIDLESRLTTSEALPGPPRPFGGLALHPSGRFVAAAGTATADVAVVVYDTNTAAEVAVIPPGDGATYWAGFTPDGSTMAVLDDLGHLRTFLADDWTQARSFDTGAWAPIPTAVFDASSSRLYLSSWGPDEEGHATLWAIDITSGDVSAGPVEVTDDAIIAMAISDDGTIVVGEEVLERFEADTLAPLPALGVRSPAAYFSLDVTDDGRIIAGSPVNLQIISIDASGEADVETIDVTAPGLGVSANGHDFVVAHASGSLSTWTTGGAIRLGEVIEPAGPGSVTLSPDREILAGWGSGRGVQLWDRATLEHMGELDYPEDTSLLGVAFNTDGTRLAVASCPFGEQPLCSGSVALWDVAEQELIVGPVDVGPVVFTVSNGIAFADDDSILAVAGMGVALLDARALTPTGDPLMLSDATQLSSDRVVIVSSTDSGGRALLSATSDTGDTGVWALTGGQPELIDTLAAIPATFLEDGTFVTGIANGPFVARDLNAFASVGPLYRATAAPGLVRSGGESVISMGGFGVELWDRETGEPTSGVIPAAFSALSLDGGTLYLGAIGFEGFGDVIRTVSLEPATLIDSACEHAGRNLTAQEWRSLMGDEPYRSTCPQWPAQPSRG